MNSQTVRLAKMANQIRRDIIEIAYKAQGPSHPGPSLSIADVMSCLYFHEMHVRPEEPHWEGRDRLVLSKGHACPALYAALAEKGFFPRGELLTVRKVGSRLQGHPDMKKTPGVDMTAGSLGNGMPIATGMALGLKASGNAAHVYAIIGDGEMQEGIIWEAAMFAGAHKLDNLTVILDYNHQQSCGSTEAILPMEPVLDKWKSFGWKTLEMNGHNIPDILDKLAVARAYQGMPTIIVAHTIKGKGVSFMENNNAWHQSLMTPEQYHVALRELEEAQSNET